MGTHVALIDRTSRGNKRLERDDNGTVFEVQEFRSQCLVDYDSRMSTRYRFIMV